MVRGKSSVYETLGVPGEFVNADLIARRIDSANPAAASLEAGREVIERLHALIEKRSDFVYETTLSSRQSLTLMRDARGAGFEVGLVFIILEDADLNVQRVSDRVRRGGHSIPEPTIRRRHRVAFERLAEAIPIAHASLVYDNTDYLPEILIRLEGLTIVESRLSAQQKQQAIAASTGLSAQDVYASQSR